MKNLRSLSIFSALVAMSILPSCGLIKSAVKVPGSILQSVGRTVGMPVSHSEGGSDPAIEIIGDGEIKQLD